MDSTKAMTVIVELLDEGMMKSESATQQFTSKTRKLRIALLHWLDNTTCRLPAGKEWGKSKHNEIRQCVHVAKNCVEVPGVFLPNSSEQTAATQSAESFELDTLNMILWIFERFYSFLATVDSENDVVELTVNAIIGMMKLVADNDSSLFANVCLRLTDFFNEVIWLYGKGDRRSCVKLAFSDLEFFTDDFDLKQCCLKSESVNFKGFISIDRIVLHLLSTFSAVFTPCFISAPFSCLYNFTRCSVVALECGDSAVKIKSLRFLSTVVTSLEKSFDNQSLADFNCTSSLLPILFSDICSLIQMIDEPDLCDAFVAEEMVRECTCLISTILNSSLLHECSLGALYDLAEICISFFTKSDQPVVIDAGLFEAFIKVICLSSKRDRRLLLSGQIFDLLDLFINNPPSVINLAEECSFSVIVRSLGKLVVLLHLDYAEFGSSSFWLEPLEESELKGLFPQPNSPGPSMPAKRQKTEEPAVFINARSIIAFSKKYPLMQLLLRQFACSISSPWPSFTPLVLGAALVLSVNLAIENCESADTINTFSALIKIILACVQNSQLMPFLESVVQSKTASLLTASETNKLLSILLFFQHVLTHQWPDKFFDNNQLAIVAGLASLPWLSATGQSNWVDLRPPPTVVKYLTNCTFKLPAFNEKLPVDHQIEGVCLDCLSLLPKDICKQWRSATFGECFKSSSVSVVRKSLQRFPYLLHILGPTSNSLVYELLHQLAASVETKSELILEIAKIVGDLACVISRQACLTKEKNFNFPTFKCSCRDQQPHVRDMDAIMVASTTTRSASSRAVDAAMFSPVMKVLATFHDKAVRRQAADSCLKLFSHLSFSHLASIELLKTACLPLLIDSDDGARLSFAEALVGVVDIGPELKTAFFEKITESNNRTNELVAYSHVLAVSALLKNAREGVFSALLTYLVNCSLLTLTSPENRLAALVAENLLADVIFRHNPDRPFMVFVECSNDLAEILCSKLIWAISYSNDKAAGDKERARRRATGSIIDIFEKIFRTFRFSDFDHCFSVVMPAVLPRLVTSNHVDMAIRVNLLELLAEQLRTTPSKLLAENIVRIWTFVLCYAQTAQAIEAANSVVRTVCKSNLDDMVARDGQKACFQLVSKLGVNYKQSVKGLRFLAEHDQATCQKLSDPQLVEFLSQRFLGILLFLDTQFQSQSVCPAEKLSLVASLFHLLTIMGANHVNTVRVKLLATLRIILKLKTKKFLEAALKAWALFVKYLEPDKLAHLLPQILVALLPLMKLFPGHVDAIFENIFAARSSTVQRCGDDISYIVVDVPEFVRHIKVLPDVTAIRRSPKSFAIACSRGCANESSEVRLLALNRLKNYLAENQTAVVTKMGSHSLEQEWGPVLAQLLKCCHDTDFNVRLAATEVFGLFGAVDPSRIPHLQSVVGPLSNSNITLSLNEVMTDTAFAFNVLMDVCRVFLAADDTKVQDAAAYALQQLLATFGVNESLLTSSQLQSNSSFGIRLWNRFPLCTQQLLKPYLKTKYVLTAKFDPSQMKTPFFGSSDRYSQYKEWLCAFTHYLIQSLPVSSSPNSSQTSQLTSCFQACKAIVRYDAALALFLLPYIALHVVTNSQQDNSSSLTSEIGLELQTVIDACVATNDHRLVASSSNVTSNSSYSGGLSREGGNTPPTLALASQAQVYVSSQLPMAAQAAFIVIDHFSRWLEQAELRNAAHQQRAMRGGSSRRTNAQSLLPAVPATQVAAVSSFLQKIPSLSLAIAAANCRYPARAMRYFEDHIVQEAKTAQPNTANVVSTAGANFLQKLFMHLGEPDGVLGVAATFCQQPTIEQNILKHEINGQLSDALTCYEQAIELQPENFDFYRGIIGCLLSLGRDTAALHTVAGIVDRQDEAVRAPVQTKFLPYQIEALGRLGDWSRLDQCLQSPAAVSSPSLRRTIEWPVGFWTAVVSLRRRDSTGFNDAISLLRRAELGPLSAASLEAASYARGYNSIVKMHVLSEMEMLAKYLLSQAPLSVGSSSSDSGGSSKKGIADTLALFDARLALSEKSLAVREPLLQFRRLATKMLAEVGSQQMLPGLNARLGQLWLTSARLARKAGRYETAYGHLLAANSYANPGELRLETAKWLWARGSREDALLCLERWLTGKTGIPNQKDQINARMLCLWTRYNEETAMLDSASIVKHYRAVVESNPRSEESYFYLAKYLSKLLLTASQQPSTSSNRNSIGGGSSQSVTPLPDGNLHLEAIRNFGQSLRYGSKFIFESMPQFVSLWLDYALAVHNYSQQYQNTAVNNARQIMMGINAEIRAMLGPVPAYQFLVVFPQLISRICHPQRETAAVLLEVAAYVMAAYPQQTTWLAIAVSRSMWPLRKKRCEELFVRLRQLKSELNQYIADFTRLTDRLCEVCDKSTDRDPMSDDSKLLSLSVSRDFRQMKRLVEEQSFSRILIPLQHLLWPTLPSCRRPTASNIPQQPHQAFPNDEIYFAGFGDEVEVMRSLQRPKRLLVRGSNGKLYGFLCKPKEDLRKDSRWMEYVTVVQSFLRRDPDASRRRLAIRTFAVIPLNEECGIIEWVDHTHGIRPILMSIYRERGIAKDQKFLLSCKLPTDAPLSEKLKVFKNRLLPAHPSVLGDWFRRNWFADASAWHEARLAFSRSTAVMSIAGYILGLGDRHGENILIDGKSGEVVHVDFSCLFNKADSFEYPEVVPFRLTHNMLHAMGPTGYEGVCRKACEITMRIMRQHSDALMIVLKSFVHDPLVEWQKPASKSKRGQHEDGGGEIVNSQAVKVLNDARNRLKGCVTSSSVDLPLSIEGHVNYVIKQATDEGNLARMYIGWGPQL